jgi:hypothetical protein
MSEKTEGKRKSEEPFDEMIEVRKFEMIQYSERERGSRQGKAGRPGDEKLKKVVGQDQDGQEK